MSIPRQTIMVGLSMQGVMICMGSGMHLDERHQKHGGKVTHRPSTRSRRGTQESADMGLGLPACRKRRRPFTRPRIDRSFA